MAAVCNNRRIVQFTVRIGRDRTGAVLAELRRFGCCCKILASVSH